MPGQDGTGGDRTVAGDVAPTPPSLEDRVARLERLADLVDLLAIPGLLANGATQLFTSGFEAADIPNELAGVFPLERNGNGVPFRWLAFPGLFEVRVPVIASIPAVVKLVTLDMAHLGALDAFTFAGPGDVAVEPLGLDHMPGGLLAATARVSAPTTRLAAVAVGCRTGLETGGRDARSLGLPFVRAQYRPEL